MVRANITLNREPRLAADGGWWNHDPPRLKPHVSWLIQVDYRFTH